MLLLRLRQAIRPQHQQQHNRQFTATRRNNDDNFDAPFTTISESGFTESQMEVRRGIQQITNEFSLKYWLERDQTKQYPHELYDLVQKNQFIGIALPTEFGGSGLGIAEAAVMLQTIAESGAGVSGAQSIHANVYPIMPIVEFASQEQKKEWIPRIIEGDIRSCFMITEPNVGLETLKLKTKAEKRGNKWVINGSKVSDSRKEMFS
jgi:acyl-CoA dehydrogenase